MNGTALLWAQEREMIVAAANNTATYQLHLQSLPSNFTINPYPAYTNCKAMHLEKLFSVQNIVKQNKGQTNNVFDIL